MIPSTLLDWLIARYPTAKRQTFKRMLQANQIRIDGVPARNLKQPIAGANAVRVAERQAISTPNRRSGLPFVIVHEDADLLIINKPAGLLTSTGPREKRPTAWAAVQEYLSINEPNARPGLIHRLDRDAAGLLVFSKNGEAYRSLKTQFFHHTVTRVYHAVVHGRVNPEAGRIESFLSERADGTVHSARTGQRAITDYETLKSSKKATLLRLQLLTGRKHQIRVHLAERGHPIVGDTLYDEKNAKGALLLMAVELQFDHPSGGKRVTFQLRTPDWINALTA